MCSFVGLFPLACKVSKCELAAASIRKTPGVKPENVLVEILDLASLQSVKEFSDHFKGLHNRLDHLILNAGVMHPPYTLTKDGIELQWAVNHVVHQLLTQELLPLLEVSQPATVVSVSSNGHFQALPADMMLDVDALSDKSNYNSTEHYGSSKLANVFFAQELARRVGDKSIFVNSLVSSYSPITRAPSALVCPLFALVFLCHCFFS